jgi:hypothetical protein
MPDCCIEYVDLPDEILVDDFTVCGGVLQAIDLKNSLTVGELGQNPEYAIVFNGMHYTDGITLNGSVIEITLKNPDERPYEEVIIASLSGDNYKYKLRLKVRFKDRCEDSECDPGDDCNPCTGDCEEGVVDAGISIIEPKGSVDLGISIQ